MTAAIMTKLALVSLREKAKSVDYKVEIFLQVHDAIYCYVQEGFENDWAEIQKTEMEKAGRIFVKSVPAKSDILISDRWQK